MKNLIKKLLREAIVLHSDISEEYPQSFNMDEFKVLKSFAERIKYCEKNLQKISSGSSRIVYKIDEEKVLKLAKNKKGLAQNEVEIEYSQYNDISDIVARVFNYEPNNLWVEMELARKLDKPQFKQITSFKWNDYVNAIHNYGRDIKPTKYGYDWPVDKKIVEAMWEDEFVYSIFNFMGNYDIPSGDLERLSTYGIVKRNDGDAVVMIDYGLTSDVYDSYYK